MTFSVVVKACNETLQSGDLFYERRKLYRVERVGKPRGKAKRFFVKFRLIGKVNLDRQRRTDGA